MVLAKVSVYGPGNNVGVMALARVRTMTQHGYYSTSNSTSNCFVIIKIAMLLLLPWCQHESMKFPAGFFNILKQWKSKSLQQLWRTQNTITY